MALPCHGCAYAKEIPGNAHLSCVFRFKNREDVPVCQSEYGCRWFHFPVNFDPTWGPDKCKGLSKKRDKKKVREKPPMEDLLRHFI